MEWLEDFWSRQGDIVLTGISVTVGGALTVFLLVKAWRFLLAATRFVLYPVYWLLIGWCARKLRRAITGEPW